ncbi:MAG: hypothetical protein C4518_00340 [Desulfobacteraceae bacterium]|nr:MAG: hypothetical protein C4518_00340 [Desulfobacteraceae bacterium]
MQTLNDPFIHQPTMRDFFLVLFKHKFKIIFFFLAVMGFAITGSLLSQKIYQSEAKLFINLGRETVTQDSDATPKQSIQVSQTLENQINSEIEILTSQELAQKVVAAIGADAFREGSPKYSSFENPLIGTLRLKINNLLEFPKNAVAHLLKPAAIPPADTNPTENDVIAGLLTQELKAEVVKNSSIIKLHYESHDPYLARDVLDQLINLYMDKHIKLLGSEGTYDFFKKESERLLQQLKATEIKLADLKNAADSELSSSTSMELQKSLYDLKQKEVEHLSTFNENSIVELQRSLYNLKQKEQELLSTFTENSIPVKDIRRQIAIAEINLQNHQTQLQNSIPVQDIRRQIAIVESSLQNRQNSTLTLQISQLEREKEIIEENYRKYAASMEQTRINQALEEEKISNIRVAQTPTVQVEPVRPNIGLILFMGLFLAVFGSLGLAFFMEYMDNSLERPEQIEGMLHLPILGSIQKMVK